MTDYQELIMAVRAGDDEAACEISDNLLAAQVLPLEIIDNGLLVAMDEIGRLFKEEEIYIPEVMMAAQTVSVVIDKLKPLLNADIVSKGKVVIGTVKGDMHDIGKDLVALLLSSNGFEVINLGTDVSPEQFIAAAQEHNADIVALSALLTITMVNMGETIKAFADAGLRDKYNIIVGGAPVDNEYAQEINADGYSEDAAGAVDLCRLLIGGQK